MAFSITSNELLNEFALFSAGQPVEHAPELAAALAQGEIELEAGGEYVLNNTIVLGTPIKFNGNGSSLSGSAPAAFMLCAGGVELCGLTLRGFACCINVDGLDKTAENVDIHDITIYDPGYGVCVNVGSSCSGGEIKNLHIHDCVFHSGYSDELSRQTGLMDGSMAFNITAACPRGSLTEDMGNTLLDGLTIERCRILGARRFGINMLVGVSVPSEGSDYTAQQGKLIDNTIRNVKVLDCEIDYCWEGGVSLMCGCLQNYGSVCENLEVARCRIVHGLMGIGYSGAGPIVPSSVSTNMGVRHGSIHDNVLKSMDIPVGEANFGIVLETARAEGFGGIEVYDCFIEDVQIYNNVVEGCETAIALVAANALSDEPLELSRNHISDVRIESNVLKNVETAFLFTAALSEGRRFDWNFGWRVIDQRWAELACDHRICTNRYVGNYIENIVCTGNKIDGCRYKLRASGAMGKGHSVMRGNKVCKGIEYSGNSFERCEDHLRVMDVDICDWVRDDGGNEVDRTLAYK